VLWYDLHTARISLTDSAMCTNLINESLFNIVISKVIFSHSVFLLCKDNCITYAWLEIFERGRQVNLGCEMDRFMKKFEKHCYGRTRSVTKARQSTSIRRSTLIIVLIFRTPRSYVMRMTTHGGGCRFFNSCCFKYKITNQSLTQTSNRCLYASYVQPAARMRHSRRFCAAQFGFSL